MSIFIGNTEFETGKWYLAAEHTPPEELWTTEATEHDAYQMLLGISGLGVRPGFYVGSEKQYYWHCERYDSFDDEPIPGWSREQEINNNLDWVYEKARGVSCWMAVPDFDSEWPSVDGSNYYDPDPDQDWSVKEADPQATGDEKIRPMPLTKTLNLIVGISKADVANLLASVDDNAADHILAVDKNGTVYLEPISDELTPAEWEEERENDLQFRLETFARSNGYTGIGAAKDESWVSRLYYVLQENWEQKNLGYIDYF